MSEATTKISRVVSTTKVGTPYAPDPKYPALKNQQVHEVIFEDGTVGKMSAPINVEHVLEAGKAYAYHIVTTAKGGIQIVLDAQPASLVTKDMGKALPNDPPVTVRASELGETLKGDPATTPPSMAKTAPFDQHERTVKPVIIPDTQPREGIVKLMRFVEPWITPEEVVKYKWIITFEDGAIGTHWTTEEDEPFAKGQKINYTYDKVYGDGSKRIALAISGANIDRETAIMRMACLNAAVALLAIEGNQQKPDPTTATLIAKAFEKHITRSEQ